MTSACEQTYPAVPHPHQFLQVIMRNVWGLRDSGVLVSWDFGCRRSLALRMIYFLSHGNQKRHRSPWKHVRTWCKTSSSPIAVHTSSMNWKPSNTGSLTKCNPHGSCMAMLLLLWRPHRCHLLWWWEIYKPSKRLKVASLACTNALVSASSLEHGVTASSDLILFLMASSPLVTTTVLVASLWHIFHARKLRSSVLLSFLLTSFPLFDLVSDFRLDFL